MSKTSSIMWVMVPTGTGIATGAPGRAAPLAAAPVNGGEQGILLVAGMGNSGPNGSPVAMIGLTDNADNVAPLTGAFVTLYQGSVTRLTALNEDTGNFDRVRLVQDTDIVAENGAYLLGTVARVQLFNGNTYDRIRSASADNLSSLSGEGVGLSSGPGEWSVNSEPAVNVQATATRAAGGANVRHICKSLHFSLAAVAAQTIVYARVRDGVSGAGTVLWSQAVIVPAGQAANITLSDLNIVGSVNTAMTFEWSGAPVATNFQTAGGSGYSAS